VQRVGSDTPWERRYGYPRAVRSGFTIAVSGTVAADRDGRPLAADAYGQSRAILRRIGEALAHLGADLGDVIRLRVHFAGADVADGFAQALREEFPAGAPALTTVRVAALAAPEFLLEIEADAVLPVTAPRREAPVAGDEGGD
jgi:enamine deaminase RidA (YjgF/YER057c/UK114 family)